MNGLPEVGTLAQIGAQFGDVVEWLEIGSKHEVLGIEIIPVGRFMAGKADANLSGYGKGVFGNEQTFRIISRASDAKQGPATTPSPPPPRSMSRADILTSARDIVTKNRQSSDASPEDSFGNIAALWSTHLDVAISSADVAVMMGLVKIARIKTNPAHADNWIDLAGYAACGGEIAMKGKAE